MPQSTKCFYVPVMCLGRPGKPHASKENSTETACLCRLVLEASATALMRDLSFHAIHVMCCSHPEMRYGTPRSPFPACEPAKNFCCLKVPCLSLGSTSSFLFGCLPLLSTAVMLHLTLVHITRCPFSGKGTASSVISQWKPMVHFGASYCCAVCWYVQGRVRVVGTGKPEVFMQGWRHRVRDEIDPRLGAPGPRLSVLSCCFLSSLEVTCGSVEYKGVLWEGELVLGNMVRISNGSWLPLTHKDQRLKGLAWQ